RLWWRSADRRVRLHTTLSLDADAHVLRCDVRGENRRRDHRLQLVWHTDVQAGDVYADAAFGPVHRGTVPRPEGDQQNSVHTVTETVPQGEPMHRWVAHATRERSVVMLSDGLAEYEVQPGRMALTLLRAVGELSRADLPERPGHAGWPSPVPEAQSQGVFEAQAGVLLTEGWSPSTRRAVHDAVDDLLLPLVGESWFDFTPPEANDSSQSWHRGGAALEGDALEASACTISTVDERAIVLRAINLADQDSVGAWVLPDDGPWLVTHCRLDEAPLLPNAEANTSASRASDGVVHGRRIELVLAPRDVLTIRLRREPGGPR
ncbi:MAG TPA: glycoside hydrolase family 38 C-terminal domain-containing protein, partial [Gemmatimonas sp.]|uniref:glycoside hydrolase family 38 C-terminal domain-containing protein n=1 Tax=Gemmatimonas sp. TaxID=1962908 RepID=UPI002ED87D14